MKQNNIYKLSDTVNKYVNYINTNESISKNYLNKNNLKLT